MRAAGLGHIPVVVGGIIPDDDAAKTPRHGRRRRLHAEGFELNKIHARHRRPGRPGCSGGRIAAPLAPALKRRLNGAVRRGTYDGFAIRQPYVKHTRAQTLKSADRGVPPPPRRGQE